jgi:hypothetical protein
MSIKKGGKLSFLRAFYSCYLGDYRSVVSQLLLLSSEADEAFVEVGRRENLSFASSSI